VSQNFDFASDLEKISSSPLVIFFDGKCGLCDRFVKFVFEKDLNRKFLFVSLQSELARSFFDQSEVKSDINESNRKYVIDSMSSERAFAGSERELSSVVFWWNKKVYVQSDAALLIISELFSSKWPRYLLYFPKFIRDLLYQLIARNRYALFGKKDACLWVKNSERGRFFL
jgi:predicted DCC family thiol-disulfide oxidoreductase YuxK